MRNKTTASICIHKIAREISKARFEHQHAFICTKIVPRPHSLHNNEAAPRIPCIHAPFLIVDATHLIECISRRLAASLAKCHAAEVVQEGILQEDLPPSTAAQECREVIIHEFSPCEDRIGSTKAHQIAAHNMEEGHQLAVLLPERRV